MGPISEDSLISLSGCSKNVLWVGYIESSVVFRSQFLLAQSLVGTCFWLADYEAQPPPCVVHWQCKAKQHKTTPKQATTTSISAREQRAIKTEIETE